MPYLLSLITATLALATIMHLKRQLRKTARIRQDLHEARASKALTGLHSLRKQND